MRAIKVLPHESDGCRDPGYQPENPTSLIAIMVSSRNLLQPKLRLNIIGDSLPGIWDEILTMRCQADTLQRTPIDI